MLFCTITSVQTVSGKINSNPFTALNIIIKMNLHKNIHEIFGLRCFSNNENRRIQQKSAFSGLKIHSLMLAIQVRFLGYFVKLTVFFKFHKEMRVDKDLRIDL